MTAYKYQQKLRCSLRNRATLVQAPVSDSWTSSSTVECVRKAVKATSVLFPLLGTINLLFVFQPPDDSTSVVAYRVANAVLQSSQVSMRCRCWHPGQIDRRVYLT